MSILKDLIIFIAYLSIANGICKFPCDWTGKFFKYTLPTNTSIAGSFEFSKRNKSEGVLNTPTLTIQIACVAIIDSHIIMQLDIPGFGIFANCITVKIISPDVFVCIGREELVLTMTVEMTNGLKCKFLDAVESGNFCDICFQADDIPTRSYPLVARANDADDDVCTLTCLGPKECVTCDEQACDNIPDITPCGYRYQQHRYQQHRFYYNSRNLNFGVITSRIFPFMM